MSDLLLPEGYRPASDPSGEAIFGQAFFREHFSADEPPACQLYERGEIPVVELELLNGATCDVYYFEAFRKRYLIALLFVDPPRCDEFYRSFVPYEAIFRVNIRYHEPARRSLGFRADYPTVTEDGDDEHPLLEAARRRADGDSESSP
ncbi:MAG: hypothetical protein D6731_18780 [Planctomycetota bacterium]|nr:MAG: hypothetical protein D6731_18780 [Planctomycetota bacterium]